VYELRRYPYDNSPFGENASFVVAISRSKDELIRLLPDNFIYNEDYGYIDKDCLNWFKGESNESPYIDIDASYYEIKTTDIKIL